jgi:sugar lactone lactonase YvrE
MTGTEANPFHAGRGMFITGDTLWAADADGVHGFNRSTGEQLAFVDFTEFEPGFINDIVQGSDGHLYITDTGNGTVYRMKNGTPSVLIDSLPSPANGITIHPESNRLVLAPWGGGMNFYSFTNAMSESEELGEFGSAQSGGNYDGIEFVGDRLIAASQVDSSLHVLSDGSDRVFIKLPGKPADIGIDTKRMRVAVPYVALNRVDIWQLPEK